MIDKLRLTNTHNNLEVEISQAYGATYILAEGGADLGTVTSNHSSYKFINQIGVYVTSSTLEIRDISIIGWVAGNSDDEMAPARAILNRLVNPSNIIQMVVKDRYRIDFLPKTSVNYATSIQQNNEVVTRFLITGMCPDPLFYLLNDSYIEAATTTPMFHFPLIIPEEEGIIMGLRIPSQITDIINEGDVSSGMRIVFESHGLVVNPKITNIVTQEYLAINKTLQAGEVITVDTREGNKSVMGELNGVTSNYYQYRDLSSSWLQLEPGLNRLQYDAETNVENLDVYISYPTRFLEVE